MKLNGQGSLKISPLLIDQITKQELDHHALSLQEEINGFRGILDEINEPDFGLNREGDAFVRFIYYSSIVGKTASITLLEDNGSWTLSANYVRITRSDQDTDPYTFKITQDSMTHEVAPDAIQQVYRNLDACFFWDIQGNTTYSVGFDGSTWILEGAIWEKDPYEYHRVKRWTPTKGSFYDACMYLISLCDPEYGFDMEKRIFE